MTLLRIYLIAAFVAMVVYTFIAFGNEGSDLGSYFFGNLAAMGWSGQFNLDFLTYLWLSALWVAWRHHFSIGGIILALVASVGGMLFLAIYLLVVSFQVNGDIKALLIGPQRAAQS